MGVRTDGKLAEDFTTTTAGADTMPVGGPFTASVFGTFGGTVDLERYVNGNWASVYQWAATAEERNGEEIANDIEYRWNAAVTSGTAECCLLAGPKTRR